MSEPILEPVKNGWAALGDGWAVHGRTQEEALERFRRAQLRHSEIETAHHDNPNQRGVVQTSPND